MREKKEGRYVVVQESGFVLDDYRKGCIKRQTFVALTALNNLNTHKLKVLRVQTPYFTEKTLYDKTKLQDVAYTCAVASMLLNYKREEILYDGWKWSMLPELVEIFMIKRDELKSIAYGKIDGISLMHAEDMLQKARRRGALDKNDNLSLDKASPKCSGEALLHTWSISSIVACQIEKRLEACKVQIESKNEDWKSD